MSSLNAYATLEEAWGSNFDDKKRKKKTISDPICGLYAQNSMPDNYNDYSKVRFQRSTLPQKSSQGEYREPELRVTSNKPIQNNLFEKQFQTSLPDLYDEKCSQINTNIMGTKIKDLNNKETGIVEQQKYIYDYPIVEPEGYGDAMVSSEFNGSTIDIFNKKNNYNDFVEEETENCEVVQEEVRHRITPEESLNKRYPIPEETYHHKFFEEEKETIKSKNNTIKMLDLMLYIISGIILIFIMDQFVKIGIQMNS
jgi:hypothetical protein